MYTEISLGIILIITGILFIIKYPNYLWVGLIIIAVGIGWIGKKLR